MNLMALIRTLTISTTMFERMKEKFDGFRQTGLLKSDKETISLTSLVLPFLNC